MVQTKHYLQKVIISKLFNYDSYNNLRLYKCIFHFFLKINRDPIYKLLPYLLVDKNPVVFDIGANIGQSACYLSKIVGRKGAVYCFEPVLDNYNLLLKMSKILHWKNVSTFNVALCDKSGHENIYIPIIDNHLIIGTRSVLETSASSILRDYKIEKVKTDTIDNFVFEQNINKLNFIKSDTEGADNRVIEGGGDTIRKFKPIMALEMNHNDKSLQILYKIGYKPYYIIKNKLINAYKIKKQHGDVILIPESKKYRLKNYTIKS